MIPPKLRPGITNPDHADFSNNLDKINALLPLLVENIRQQSILLFHKFTHLKAAGFTDAQAMEIVKAWKF